MISTDSPSQSLKFKRSKRAGFTFLSDEDHQVADQYGVPVQRNHPMSHTYRDGFIQPAVFAYKKDEPVFEFIQKPKAINLWGASGRPSPEQILKILRKALR